MIKIARIEGDGIGREVMEAGVAVLDSLNLNLDYVDAEAGRACFEKNGTTLPDETIEIAKKSKATLFGAITSTPGQKSPIVTLRKELDVYGNLRPIKSYAGVDCLFDDLDFLIVRENTEGLYSGLEEGDSEKAIAKRVITRKASERIIRLAFNQAVKLEKESVTCVHKSNVLKKTDGVFKECFYKVAEEYPQIKTRDYYVDALFGDILSDASAGLVGGLGLAPSGNIGDEHGLFEPVHGSAPDIAGKNISNPIAMILSVSMMLDYLNEDYLAGQVRTACENVLRPDLGGSSKTMDVANEVIKEINSLE